MICIYRIPITSLDLSFLSFDVKNDSMCKNQFRIFNPDVRTSNNILLNFLQPLQFTEEKKNSNDSTNMQKHKKKKEKIVITGNK